MNLIKIKISSRQLKYCEHNYWWYSIDLIKYKTEDLFIEYNIWMAGKFVRYLYMFNIDIQLYGYRY